MFVLHYGIAITKTVVMFPYRKQEKLEGLQISFLVSWIHDQLQKSTFNPCPNCIQLIVLVLDLCWIMHLSHKIWYFTAHNWENWKGVFLICYCHEVYRVEAVCLKNYNYIRKITIFVKMGNFGQFLEKSIFCR